MSVKNKDMIEIIYNKMVEIQFAKVNKLKTVKTIVYKSAEWK